MIFYTATVQIALTIPYLKNIKNNIINKRVIFVQFFTLPNQSIFSLVPKRLTLLT